MTARPGRVAASDAAELTGLPVRAIHALIGGRENTSQLIEVAGTGRVLLQQLRTRVGAPHRLRLAKAVPPAAARVGVPVPAVVAADAHADPAWFIRRFVEGRSATATFRHPDQAARMASGAGRWCARWRTIDPTGMRPYRLWADARRLQSAASRWRDRLSGQLDDGALARLGADVDALPSLLSGRPVVLAHGDFNPANLLVDGRGEPIAVIDVEFTRVADPLFDPAWFRAALAIWAPRTRTSTWEAFWAAYRREHDALGLGDPADDADVQRRLEVLGRLRLLEIVEHTRERPDARLWRQRMEILCASSADPA